MDHLSKEALCIVVLNGVFHSPVVIQLVQTCHLLTTLAFGTSLHCALRNRKVVNDYFVMKVDSYIPPKVVKIPRVIIHCSTSREFAIVDWKLRYEFMMDLLFSGRFLLTDTFYIYPNTRDYLHRLENTIEYSNYTSIDVYQILCLILFATRLLAC